VEGHFAGAGSDERGDFIANDLGISLGLAVAVAYLAVPRQLVEKPQRD